MLAFSWIPLLLLSLGETRGSTPTSGESLLRKCRNPVQTAPLVFVDGRGSTEPALKLLQQDDVTSVQVLCINPRDSTVLAPGSGVTGIGAIVVWTRLGPASRLEPAITELLEAQRAHLARTGAFSRDLASLQLAAPPAEVKLSLAMTSTGWRASAWIDRPFSPRCSVSGVHVVTGDGVSTTAIQCTVE